MNSAAVDAAGEGLRERKKRERKQALYQAAADLCLAQGYEHVTVDDICERCDVAPRTFFNYFSSKEEAVLGREDVIFDDEDQPAVIEFEHGSPTGELLADFRVLLTLVVQTRAESREDLHRRVELFRSDPSLLQALLGRMEGNMRLFRQMIERRLARESGIDIPSVEDHSLDPALDTVFGRRAHVLAGLGVTVLRLTFERMTFDTGADAASTVPAVFDDLHHLFSKDD